MSNFSGHFFGGYLVLFLTSIFQVFCQIEQYKVCLSTTLPQITNGYYLEPIISLYNEKTYFRCSQGFGLVGNDFVTCQVDGTWSKPGGYCISFLTSTRCLNLPSLANGTVSFGLNSVGAVRQVTCDDGYATLTPTTTCQPNGTWSKVADCKPDTFNCPEPPKIPNGNFVANKLPFGSSSLRTYGSILELRCNTCYKRADSLNNGLISCNGPKRLWTRLQNRCVIIECSDLSLPIIINARVKNGESTCGSVREINCNTGFRRLIGEPTMCQENGLWSKPVVVCVPNSTSPPRATTRGHLGMTKICNPNLVPNIENGVVDASWFIPNTVGSMRQVTCNEGFQLKGGFNWTICQQNGTWSQPGTVCSRLPETCLLKEMPLLRNGYYFGFNNSSTAASFVGVACYDGYTLTGPPEISCDSHGEWTLPGDCLPSETTTEAIFATSETCEMVTLPFLANGHYVGLNAPVISAGAFVTGKCYPGFTLVGSERITCLSNGKWALRGSCLPTADVTSTSNCSSFTLPSLINGFFLIQTNTVVQGDKIEISCYDGYTLVGPSDVTCQATGSWSTPGVCTKVLATPTASRITPRPVIRTCTNKTLPNIQNGYVEPGESGFQFVYPVYSILRIKCDEGFVQKSGLDTTTCLSLGLWSNSFAVCSPRVTQSTRTCNASRLPEVNNAEVDDSWWIPNTVGTTRKVQCNSGFIFQGGYNFTICQNDGSWSQPGTICAPSTQCLASDVPFLTNGYYLSLGQVSTPGTLVKIVCYEGYASFGADKIICDSKGKWTLPGDCLPQLRCRTSDLPLLRNGNFQTESKDPATFLPGTKLEIRCSDGYELVGSTNFTICLPNGQWQTQQGQCVLGSPQNLCTRSSLPYISNGDVWEPDFKERYPKNTILQINCNSGYQCRGEEAFIKCLGNDIWSEPCQCSNEAERRLATSTPAVDLKCSSLNFPRINYGFVDVNVSSSSMVDVGTVYRLQCNDGFRFASNLKESIFCRPDGTWSEPSSNCIRVPGCAVSRLPQVENGSLDVTGLRQNVAVGTIVNIRCSPGYLITGAADLRCEMLGKWSIPGKCIPNYWLTEKPTQTTLATQRTTTTAKTTTTTPLSCSNNTFPIVANGYVVRGKVGFLEVYPINTLKHVTCNYGYIYVSGFNVTKCLGMDTWSNPYLNCARITTAVTRITSTTTMATTPTPSCKGRNLPTLKNARAVDVGQDTLVSIGTTVIVMCKDGFEHAAGSDEIFCKNDLTWSPPTIVCSPIGCSPKSLPAVKDGFVDILGIVKPVEFGTIRPVRCNDGYVLVGAGAVFCQNTGYWTEPGQCVLGSQPASCGDLPSIPNGRVVNGPSSIGTVRRVVCKPGYSTLQWTITCQSNGKWSKVDRCSKMEEEESCPEPPNVLHGRWIWNQEGSSAKTFRAIGAVLQMICDENCYMRTSGSTAFIRCGRNREWSSPQVTCKQVECSSTSLPVIENGRLLNGPSTCGTTRDIACNSGFVLTGIVTTITCQNTSYWSSPESRCVRSKNGALTASCGTPPDIPHGKVEEGGSFAGARRKIFCERGFRLDSLPYVLNCLSDGNWSKAPQCVQAGCEEPPPENIGVDYFINEKASEDGTYRVGTLAAVRCVFGYRLIIPGTLTCREDGIWSGTSGVCQRTRCYNLPQVMRGYYRPEGQEPYYVGAQANLVCTAGFKPKNASTSILCDPTGNWANPDICIAKQCSNTPEVMGGFVAPGSYEVGAKREVVCNFGTPPVGSASIACNEDGTWSLPGICG